MNIALLNIDMGFVICTANSPVPAGANIRRGVRVLLAVKEQRATLCKLLVIQLLQTAINGAHISMESNVLQFVIMGECCAAIGSVELSGASRVGQRTPNINTTIQRTRLYPKCVDSERSIGPDS